MAMVSSAYFLTFIGELKVVRTKMLILPISPSDDENTSTIGAHSERETANGSVRSATPASLSASEANSISVSSRNLASPE